jgi:glycine hydroxymethyltransferase
MGIDLKILEILEKEEERQSNTIELIASENFASDIVRDICASVFTNKYAEGIPGRRFYNGCEHADEIENLAIEYATTLFGCQFANVQPHSGANANFAVFKALLQPGDVILGMDLSNGGHLSHGSPVNVSGSWFRSAKYTLDANGFIDYDQVAKIAAEVQPKLIIAGASNYSQVIDWKKFRLIANNTNSYLLCDIAHYSGLVASGQYPNPFPYAHVATSTTHKTLRGPRGGIILWNDRALTPKINNAVFPGTQGGPLMHIIAAKAQCFYEALQKDFRTYSQQVILNAKAMVEVFKDNNVDVVSGGTECHMFTIDLGKEQYSGREFANLLEKNGITVNKNAVPGDIRNFIETSGIRIGTAAETTRGHDETWFRELAQKITDYLRN